MTFNKPNSMQIVAGVGMLLALVGTFLTWWKLDVPETEGMSFDYSVSGLDYTKGVFVLIFALLAIILLVLSLLPSLFPENIQLALLGAPVVQFALGVLALLLVLFGLLSAGEGSDMFDDYLKRGVGLWLSLLGALVWVGVTGYQSLKILQMAQAMKASQTPPPAAPPAV